MNQYCFDLHSGSAHIIIIILLNPIGCVYCMHSLHVFVCTYSGGDILREHEYLDHSTVIERVQGGHGAGDHG